MALTNDEIDILRTSLRQIEKRRSMAAGIFYDRLFELAPETRILFSDDLEALTEKVMLALGAVVGQIHDVAACRSMTADLAHRHVSYGVMPAHYEKVGEALLVTLGDVLEDGFTPEVREAWRKAYHAISRSMIEVAYAA